MRTRTRAAKVKNETRKYRDEQVATMKRRGFYPIPEAAKKCFVVPSTLYRWIDDGKVAGIQVGSGRYVSIDSLQEYMGDGILFD